MLSDTDKEYIREILRALVSEVVAEALKTRAESTPSDDILDSSDVCRLLKISKRSLADLISHGKIKPRKLLGKNYFRQSEIIETLFNNEN